MEHTIRSVIDKKRISIFLIFAFGLSWATALVIFLTGGLENSPAIDAGGLNISLAFILLGTIYMFAPAIANVLTRFITKDRGQYFLRPLFSGGRWLYFLIAWLLPGVLTVFGMALFFLLFPRTFDPGLSTLQTQLETVGAVNVNLWAVVIGQTLSAFLLSPLLNIISTFGEEFGWRAYLLPKLMPLGGRKAVILSGVIWGVWHWPIILMGHNYGLNYFGSPFLGPLAMIWFCIIIGILFSWFTVKSESVWPAVIGHGALNGIAALGLLFITGNPSSLLGPAPTGLIGGAGFTIVGLILYLHPRTFKKISHQTNTEDVDSTNNGLREENLL